MPETRVNGKLWQAVLVVLGLSGGFAAAIFYMGGLGAKLDAAIERAIVLTEKVDEHIEDCSSARLDSIEDKIDNLHNNFDWLRAYVIGTLHPPGPNLPDPNSGEPE